LFGSVWSIDNLRHHTYYLILLQGQILRRGKPTPYWAREETCIDEKASQSGARSMVRDGRAIVKRAAAGYRK
jgi:hypothetical protein